MKRRMAPAIVLLAAMAVVALRAAAGRPELRWVRGMRERHGSRGLSSRPTGAAEHVFHELHADGRHELCGVCDGRYGSV